MLKANQKVAKVHYEVACLRKDILDNLTSEREFICENCGQVKDRDLNAAINLRNYGLKQLRVVNPEVTPMDKEALVYPSSIGINETALGEVGISECSL